MSLRTILLVGPCYLVLVGGIYAQQSPAHVAKAFLPPGGEMAELVKYDQATGEPKERAVAVLTGHITSPESNDLVFAYYTRAGDLVWKSLFVTLLHKTDSGYVKLTELAYPNRGLWVQEFSTVGLKILRLPGRDTDSIAVITSTGASLGAQLEILNWNNDWGLKDVMAENGSVRHFGFRERRDSLKITLSFEKYPGEEGAPPAASYTWCGDAFIKSN